MSQPDAPGPRDVKGLEFLFRALRHRNYRLYFGGQSISLIGTWLSRVATSWLVYRLTDSPFILGFVGFAGQIPMFLLSPLAGVWVDRWDRHRILVITQILSMLQSLILAGLALAHIIAVWHIVVLSILQGIINSFDTPARQAFVVDIIEQRDDVANAIALNSSMFNAARLIGPSIGGILIAAAGEGICFLLDGISYLAVIVSLLAMKLVLRTVKKQPTHVLEALKEGFTYTFGIAPIRGILLLISLISLMGVPYLVLMPVVARDILQGGPHTLGFLMAASGLGAVAGAIYMASRSSVRGLGKIITLASGLFGFGLIAFSFSRTMWLSVSLMLLTGFALIVQMAASNTVLQLIVDDDKRGRVMSFYTMSFLGVAPFGSLFAGGLASQIGTPHTILIGGISCVLASIWFVRIAPRVERDHSPDVRDKKTLIQNWFQAFRSPRS